jgi:hypothetical protein
MTSDPGASGAKLVDHTGPTGRLTCRPLWIGAEAGA